MKSVSNLARSGAAASILTTSKKNSSVRCIATLSRAVMDSSTSTPRLHCTTTLYPRSALDSFSYLQIRLKSKRSQVSSPAPSASDDDVPVLHTKGKGKKSGIGKAGSASTSGSHSEAVATSTRNDELPGEKFDIKKLASNMENSVERAKKTVGGMIGGHGRADPGLLDQVKVVYRGGGDGQHPLRDFATVGVRDGDLLVTPYDQKMMKHVGRAIYIANLGLVPQTIVNDNESTIRVPIPRPTLETRAALLKDVSRICENARVSIRSARHTGQKQLKLDVDNKVVGTSEAKKEGQQLESETKKYTSQVDAVFQQAKKTLEFDD